MAIKKQPEKVVCDECGKEEVTIRSYFEMPRGWNYAYFNNIGGDNDRYDYCSVECFTKELGRRLDNEKKSRIENFSRQINLD